MCFHKSKVLNDGSAHKLFSKFGINPSGFAVILKGKDRSQKFRPNAVLSTGQLFKKIDSMPLRKLGMKKDGK